MAHRTSAFSASRHAVVRAMLGAALLAPLAWVPAHADTEVSGVKFPDQITVAGKPLVFNGAGVRYKAVFKVYAAALYLPRKTGSIDEVLRASAGPQRLHIVMLRDIDAGELGKLFYRGMEDNMDRGSFAKLVPGVMRMSQIFTDYKKLKEGDSFSVDWVPGTGTVIVVNGKQAGEPFKEPEFYAAVMRIWLGAKPADWKLKDALMGKSEG